MTSLTKINLAGNYFGPEGAKALGPAISVSKSLTCVYLENNYLGPDGGQAIAKAISVSKSLTSVDLRCNDLSLVSKLRLRRKTLFKRGLKLLL